MSPADHTNHRKRVKDRFLSEGLDGFEPHQALELVLFYSIPRRDTNETAHRLIDRFGSLSAVFEAEREELMTVEGIGESTATYIKALSGLVRRLSVEKAVCEIGEQFDTQGKLEKYVTALFSGLTNERVYLLMFDGKRRLIECAKILDGSVNSLNLSPRILIEKAIRRNAAGVCLAHNHPSGLAIPSGDDLALTHQLVFTFGSVGIELIEHYIVAGDKCAPVLGTVNFGSKI